MKYTIVTVSHAVDLPLLKLQARSLNRYLDRSFIQEIIVVDNSTSGALNIEQLMPQYGNLPVRLLKTSNVVAIPNWVHGWFTQQIVKLMVARQVRTKRYILLDAKNHLLKPVNVNEFEASDGRARTSRHAYGQHTLKRYLLRCCEYLRIKPQSVMDHFIPTTPPFTMITDVVRQLINDIEHREDCPFAETFAKQGLTEFFLYGSFIVSTGHKLDDYYQFDNVLGAGMWKEYSNKMMRDIIANPKSAFFAVHRCCFKNMDKDTVHALAQLWHNRKLFASYHDSRRFIEGCAKTYA